MLHTGHKSTRTGYFSHKIKYFHSCITKRTKAICKKPKSNASALRNLHINELAERMEMNCLEEISHLQFMRRLCARPFCSWGLTDPSGSESLSPLDPPPGLAASAPISRVLVLSSDPVVLISLGKLITCALRTRRGGSAKTDVVLQKQDS